MTAAAAQPTVVEDAEAMRRSVLTAAARIAAGESERALEAAFLAAEAACRFQVLPSRAAAWIETRLDQALASLHPSGGTA